MIRSKPKLLRACLTALAVVLAFAALACAPAGEGPLWADPGTVRVSPGRTQAQVKIHNTSGLIRPIGGYQLRGEDWRSFRFVDESLPRTIPGGDSVEFTLAVSPASFRDASGEYREGSAVLRFASDQHDYELPIAFVPDPSPRGSPATSVLIAVLAGLAALVAAAMVSPRSGPSLRGPLLARLRSPSAGRSLEQRVAIAAALAAGLLLVALIPLGPGLCGGRLGDAVGPLELAQCRGELGGHALVGLAATPSALWWLVGLAASTALTLVVAVQLRRPRAPLELAGLALPLVRLLGFVLVLAALLLSVAPGPSASDLVVAQTRPTPFAGLSTPRWGLLAQPLGFLLALALVASAGTSELGGRAKEPTLTLLTGLDQLIWAALLCTIFLGGWTIPGVSERPVPLTSHAGDLALGALALGLKLALVLALTRKLGRWISDQLPDPADRLRLHGRWTLGLAVLNLLAAIVLA